MGFLQIACFVLLSLQVYSLNIISKSGLCSYKFENKVLTFPDETLKVKTPKGEIFFTICKSVNTVLHSSCKGDLSVCVVDKDQVINAGKDFIVQATTNNNNLVLKTINGQSCGRNYRKNYTITLELVCSQNTGAEPELIKFDECSYSLRMMSPDCIPFCTIRKNYKLIDLRAIKSPLLLNYENKTFSISLCGENPDCSANISSCEISANSVIPISTISEQQIDYDSNNNVIVKGSFKYKRGKRRRLEVLIKCNWKTVGYKNFQAEGIHGNQYKFSLQSSNGCMIYKPNCVYTDLFNYKYDITKLYRKNSYWDVKNSPNKMIINVCGPLSLDSINNDCTDTDSQICEIRSGEHINHGSIYRSFKIEDDILQATIIDGTECKENSTKNYNTIIQFICAKKENGPIFLQSGNCTTYLSWSTPRACPSYYVSGDNCYVTDQLGPRKLSAISQQQNDTIVNISNESKLRYRFCSSLNNPCGKINNASVCLEKNGKPRVIGLTNNKLISENGQLTMTLQGETCSNGNQAETVVNFVCSNQKNEASHVQVVEDDCKYNLTIPTSLACVQQTAGNCQFCSGEGCIDLSPLSLENKNYIIQDNLNREVQYILNVCRSVKVDLDTVCPLSMICMRNQSEAHIKDMYKSFGGINDPELTENGAVITTVGSSCGNQNYKSVINLVCSEKNESPKLLKNDLCTYEFQWNTKYACTKNLMCIYKNANTGSILDLSASSKKIFALDLTKFEIKYKFDICSNNYIKCISGNCREFVSENKLFSNELGAFIEYKLGNKCNDFDPYNRVLFHVICDQLQNNDHFEYDKNMDNCTLNINLKTSIACSYKESVIITKIIKTEHELSKKTHPEFLQQFNNNCTFTNANGPYVFNTTVYTLENVSVALDRYIANHKNLMSDCVDSICERSLKFKLLGYDCPSVVNDNDNTLIKLHFTKNFDCTESSKFAVESIIKCDEIYSPVKLIKDSDCVISLESSSPEICKLFPRQSIVTSAAIYGAVFVLFCLIVGFVLFWCWRKFKRPYCKVSRKDRTLVYCKNSEL